MAYGRNRRKAKRLARAKAVADVRARGEKLGLTEEEIVSAQNEAYNSFNTKPTWRIKLRNNSAKYGEAWGQLGITIGTIVQAAPGIGTVVGAAIIGIGTGHIEASKQHADKLAREEQAKENTRFLLSAIIDDTVESELPPTNDYEPEDYEPPVKEGGIINDFLGGLYLAFFAKQAENDIYYYQTEEYETSMNELREIARQRGVSVAFLREEYRREHGTLEGTIFDYTIKVSQ